MGQIPAACEWWSCAATGEASSGEMGISTVARFAVLTRVDLFAMAEAMDGLLDKKQSLFGFI